VRVCATEAEAELRKQGISARAITTGHRDSYAGGILQIDAPGKTVDIPISVLVPGKYRITVRLHSAGQNEPVALGLKGGPSKKIEEVAANGSMVELGETEVVEDRTFLLTVESAGVFAVDCVRADVVKP